MGLRAAYQTRTDDRACRSIEVYAIAMRKYTPFYTFLKAIHHDTQPYVPFA